MPRKSLAERRKRLIVLADWLEKKVLPSLNGAKFNMGVWAKTRKKVTEKVLKTETIAAAKECGYTGCAVGWALFSPRLRKDGIAGILEPPTVFDKEKRNYFFVDEYATIRFFGLGGYAEFQKAFCGPGIGQRGIVKVAKRLRELAASPVDKSNW